MVPLLNRLDSALEYILGEYGKSLILDSKGIEELQLTQGPGAEQAAEQAKIILDFTCMLLKNAVQKEVYASIQVTTKLAIIKHSLAGASVFVICTQQPCTHTCACFCTSFVQHLLARSEERR